METYSDGIPLFSQQHPPPKRFSKWWWQGVARMLSFGFLFRAKFSTEALTGEFTKKYD